MTRYNSAVFPSITTKKYGAIILPDDLQPTESLVPNDYTAGTLHRYMGYTFNELQNEISNGTFHNFSVPDCLSKYDEEYNTERGTLLLFTDREHFHNKSVLGATDCLHRPEINWVYTYMLPEKENWTNLSVGASHLSYTWTFRLPGIQDDYVPLHDLESDVSRMGDSFAKDVAALSHYITDKVTVIDLDRYLKAPSHWTNSSWASDISFRLDSFSVPITRCMSKEAKQGCQFYFSLPICLAVIACNGTKVVCMYLTAKTSHRNILLTVGDGLSSFLDEPDPTTKDGCFLSSSGVTRPETSSGTLPRRKRWFQSASWRRWAVTLWL